MAIQQVFTPVEAGAQFLAWAGKACRKKLTHGKFLFPIRDVAGRKVNLLMDIESVLLAEPVVAVSLPWTASQQTEQRPGRVRSQTQQNTAALGLSVAACDDLFGLGGR